LGDEGAANHMRLCASHAEEGVEVFVFGRVAFENGRFAGKFQPRQSREASQAVARLHRLASERTVFVQQSQRAVDEGAFHNDVVAVSNETVIFAHEHAFADSTRTWDEIKRACPFEPQIVEVREADVPLADARKTYLFNSQLLTLPW
jgi:succinylarginine dihydrolase